MDAHAICTETGCLAADCPHCKRRRSRYTPRSTSAKAAQRPVVKLKLWPSKKELMHQPNAATEHSIDWTKLQESPSGYAQARLQDLTTPARYSIRRIQTGDNRRYWRNSYRRVYKLPLYSTALLKHSPPMSAAFASTQIQPQLSSRSLHDRLTTSFYILLVRLYALLLTAVERARTLGIGRILSGVDFRGIRQVKTPVDLDLEAQ
ncbi:hypothetical protein BCR37DRAFT_395633 [Protomyces lactucae-debilis]|uniref:Uncharacterized protein n=1 Tax=Protomyces lactucae-debilis TaxID=2754530 RepID=A0A1Y2EU84_PROLT|nr:uncharacterized protein BCR37DRAFT_395633 [Protomyces lactucae-debilis]ORY75132.1 hypothetical protein BCR37DRAFT_395633 [Protomyces lactucae-debilis]